MEIKEKISHLRQQSCKSPQNSGPINCHLDTHSLSPSCLGNKMPKRETVTYQLSALCQIRMNGSLQCQTCAQTRLPTREEEKTVLYQQYTY